VFADGNNGNNGNNGTTELVVASQKSVVNAIQGTNVKFNIVVSLIPITGSLQPAPYF
jgi:hypothetical protein